MNNDQLDIKTLPYIFSVTLVAALGLAACSDGAPFDPGSGGTGGTGGIDASGGSDAEGGSAPCPDDLALCDGVCVATSTDEAHCGGCGNVCGDGEICAAGSCALSCPPGQEICNEDCVDTDVDGSHCGACDNVCDPGQVCDGGGSCALTCQDGLVECDGKCIDPTVDPTYCGASATCQGMDAGETCGAGQACVDGECKALAITKFVFVSSVTHDGNFGGLAGADAFCQNLADLAGLPGTYLAWLSDDTGSPATRFTPSSNPYVLVDGTIVADDWADLTDGTLDHAIDKTELNGSPSPGSLGVCGNTSSVWSNTNADGTIFTTNHDCTEWTGQGGTTGSVWGRWTFSDSFWSNWCGGGTCTFQSSLYCFEQ